MDDKTIRAYANEVRKTIDVADIVIQVSIEFYLMIYVVLFRFLMLVILSEAEASP